MLGHGLGVDDFPLDVALLDQMRVRAQKRARRSQLGGHLRRTHGQSLEFREHRAYLPGDDFRHIDWRSSARRRHGQRAPSDGLLVRRFAAEERQTIAISIDSRATMFLPELLPKLTIALWVARAIATIATSTGDSVVLHRLFGATTRVEQLRGRSTLSSALSYLRQVEREPIVTEQLEVASIGPLLRPTTVWIILSDFYFADHDGELVRAMVRAQRGLCWVIALDLDSWPAERLALLERPTLAMSPQLGVDAVQTELSEQQAQVVDHRIAEHKQELLEPARRGGLDRTVWRWPPQLAAESGAELVREHLLNDPVIMRLFRREP